MSSYAAGFASRRRPPTAAPGGPNLPPRPPAPAGVVPRPAVVGGPAATIAPAVATPPPAAAVSLPPASHTTSIPAPALAPPAPAPGVDVGAIFSTLAQMFGAQQAQAAVSQASATSDADLSAGPSQSATPTPASSSMSTSAQTSNLQQLRLQLLQQQRADKAGPALVPATVPASAGLVNNGVPASSSQPLDAAKSTAPAASRPTRRMSSVADGASSTTAGRPLPDPDAMDVVQPDEDSPRDASDHASRPLSSYSQQQPCQCNGRLVSLAAVDQVARFPLPKLSFRTHAVRGWLATFERVCRLHDVHPVDMPRALFAHVEPELAAWLVVLPLPEDDLGNPAVAQDELWDAHYKQAILSRLAVAPADEQLLVDSNLRAMRQDARPIWEYLSVWETTVLALQLAGSEVYIDDYLPTFYQSLDPSTRAALGARQYSTVDALVADCRLVELGLLRAPADASAAAAATILGGAARALPPPPVPAPALAPAPAAAAPPAAPAPAAAILASPVATLARQTSGTADVVIVDDDDDEPEPEPIPASAVPAAANRPPSPRRTPARSVSVTHASSSVGRASSPPAPAPGRANSTPVSMLAGADQIPRSSSPAVDAALAPNPSSRAASASAFASPAVGTTKPPALPSSPVKAAADSTAMASDLAARKSEEPAAALASTGFSFIGAARRRQQGLDPIVPVIGAVTMAAVHTPPAIELIPAPTFGIVTTPAAAPVPSAVAVSNNNMDVDQSPVVGGNSNAGSRLGSGGGGNNDDDDDDANYVTEDESDSRAAPGTTRESSTFSQHANGGPVNTANSAADALRSNTASKAAGSTTSSSTTSPSQPAAADRKCRVRVVDDSLLREHRGPHLWEFTTDAAREWCVSYDADAAGLRTLLQSIAKSLDANFDMVRFWVMVRRSPDNPDSPYLPRHHTVVRPLDLKGSLAALGNRIGFDLVPATTTGNGQPVVDMFMYAEVRTSAMPAFPAIPKSLRPSDEWGADSALLFVKLTDPKAPGASTPTSGGASGSTGLQRFLGHINVRRADRVAVSLAAINELVAAAGTGASPPFQYFREGARSPPLATSKTWADLGFVTGDVLLVSAITARTASPAAAAAKGQNGNNGGNKNNGNNGGNKNNGSSSNDITSRLGNGGGNQPPAKRKRSNNYSSNN
ncbi:hypothetical protein H9P43_001181 [Blastocladiella emersonii ATCC 22665]|nr:hypothetical protein H9P43_001181 [Blastocladiella emersonii ATCC 22665]